MTIFCRVCKAALQSSKPDETAQQAVMTAMGTHLAEKHPHDATDLAVMLQLCATYLLLKKYVTIPDAETTLRQSFGENEQALLEVFELKIPVNELQ